MPVHLTSDQIAAIAREVASYLSETWSYAEDPDWPGAIDSADGLRIHLHQDYPATGRVTGVVPDFPCGLLTELERDRGRMYVDLSLPAPAIARLIERTSSTTIAPTTARSSVGSTDADPSTRRCRSRLSSALEVYVTQTNDFVVQAEYYVLSYHPQAILQELHLVPSRCLLALRLRLERDVLSLMLRRDRLVSEVGDTSSAEELFVALGTFHPDIVLLDSNLVAPADPALHAVRRSSGGPRFLVLAASGTPEDAVPWLAVRIDGYLPKSAPLEDLRRAVRTLLGGRLYIHPPIAEALVEYVTPDGFQPPSLDRLSTRERQIFDLIARGTRTAEIADKLGVSVKTVFTYRARMLQKLALRNNAQVVLFALRHAGDGRLDGDPLVPDSGVNDAEPST